MSAVARSVAVPIGAACAGAWRDKPYRETLTLHDGWHVNLRPIHRSDASALRDFFFGSLSPRTRLMRFHGVVNVLPDDVLRALATQQPHRRVALVALTTTDDGVPRLLAEARYVVDDAGEAEFALAVGDAWQGQGLGRALVQRLAAHARAEGLAMLVGTVMPGNEPMLHLMQVLGAEVRSDASEVQVRLPL